MALYLNKSEIELTIGLEVKVDRRIQFNVVSPLLTSSSAPTTNGLLSYDEDDGDGDNFDDVTCTYSPTPHHMVLHSDYNHMIGEFYSRSILGVYQMLRNVPSSSLTKLHYYVHFVDRRNDLFDGHKLFLGGLPKYNDRLDNFVSIMPDDTCRCYSKLIFCGYDVVTKNNSNNSARSTISHPRRNRKNNNNVASLNTDEDEDESASDSITLKPGQMIGKSKCNPPNCTVYRELRQGLLENYSLKYPNLDERIYQYRRKILIDEKILLKNDTIGDINDWKFVGLTHRKLRRKWLNINDALVMCRQKFSKYKVVCLKVNVEETDSPMEQLLMHRSLHALIGVHGAQLTQGVLLPNHAYIVELLPWIPDYLWGGWVATVNQPTPLGVIFVQTELNHLGYSLGRDSVPFCLDIYRSEDEDADRLCMLNKTSGVRKKIRWDVRDFTVPVDVIEDFLSTFLLQDVNATCDDVETRGNAKNFVLYNVYCRQSTNSRQLVSRQFYKNENLTAIKMM